MAQPAKVQGPLAQFGLELLDSGDIISRLVSQPTECVGVSIGGRVTPILVRPVREQLEHDRVIRLLQLRWRRKYLVTINQGNETTASVVNGELTLYPDLVLAPASRPNKPEIVVEVETGESVNNLEAMAEWERFARLKAAFHLYVPMGSVEPARRLCTNRNIPVAEIWTYHPVGDQMRFTMVYKAPAPSRPARRPVTAAPAARGASHAPAGKRRPASNSAAGKTAAPKRPAKAASASRSRPKKAAARPVGRATKSK
jgi:hypothetical protein